MGSYTQNFLVLKPPGGFQSSSIQLMLAFQSAAAWRQSHQRAAPADTLYRDPSWDHAEELPSWLHYTGRKTIKMDAKKKYWVPLKVISDTHEKLWKISTNITDTEMAFCRWICIKIIPSTRLHLPHHQWTCWNEMSGRGDGFAPAGHLWPPLPSHKTKGNSFSSFF